MGKKSQKNKKRCLAYFNARTRIKNRTKKLLKRIKDIKPETQAKIIEHSPIKRKREKSG